MRKASNILGFSLLSWILNPFSIRALPSGFLLQEDGFNLLQENGDKIIIEPTV
jgi:hypothetical protein